MIKVFIPEIKGRVKSSIRGFWYSQDTKRTYYDYLTVEPLYFLGVDTLEQLRVKHNQEALFIVNVENSSNKKGYIYYSPGRIEELRKGLGVTIGRNTKTLRGIIRKLLKAYGGVTVYKEDKGYLIEVFFND